MAEPVATPVTTPVELTEATAELLELHTPPDVLSVSVIVEPVQAVAGPFIAWGADGVDVTINETVVNVEPQPLVTIYEITAAPTVTPVTDPLAFTVATEVLLELQTPPEVASLRVVDVPTQVVGVPEMAATDGVVFTVNA